MTRTNTRALANWSDAGVSPLDFGAVGDGVTDDTQAVRDALNSGKPVFGGGLTFKTTGNIDATNLVSLSDCTLTRPELGDSLEGYVLQITNSGFILDNVTFIYGDSRERAFTGINGGINKYFGLRVYSPTGTPSSPNDFTIRDCKFTGNGTGTHLMIENCNNFSVRGCHVFNSDAKDPELTDDGMQGLSFLVCDHFSVSQCSARRLRTWEFRPSSETGVNTQDSYIHIMTRGFSFSGSSDYSVTDCHTREVDQGFDITGSGVNTRWIVGDCSAEFSGTVGFKCANGPSHGMFSNCLTRNTGLYSFVASSGVYPNDHDIARYITFNNCKAIDTGVPQVFAWGSVAGSPPTRAFAVLNGNAESNTEELPLRVQLHGCEVFQENATVSAAYYSSQLIPNVDANNATTFSSPPRGTVSRDCSVYAISPGTVLNESVGAIGPVFLKLGLSQDQDLTSNIGSWTFVEWDNEISDNFNLHNNAYNRTNIYIRDSGVYTIAATLVTSERPDDLLAQFYVNGNEIPGSLNAAVGLDQGAPSSVSLNYTGRFTAGSNLRTQIKVFKADGQNIVLDDAYTSLTFTRIN